MKTTYWLGKALISVASTIALAGCFAAYQDSTPTASASATKSVMSAGKKVSIGQGLEPVVLTQPAQRAASELEVLFWDDATRAARFRKMEDYFAGHEVPAASTTRALPAGEPLDAGTVAVLRSVMADSNAAGIMVLQGGKVRFEEYGLGLAAEDRWTSFSVAKSFTSTLLAAAIKDGFITGLDAPVTRYVPGLAGSSYEGVSVGQLMTMQSGVDWDESYTDPASDVAQMGRFVLENGSQAIVTQMKGLDRAAEPGTKWNYSTGETNLIGLLVENAVGMSLAEYAQTKIVEPAGFAGDMFWMVDPREGNIGGCCLSLRLSDYARMGQFALEDGKGMVPEGWFAKAGSPQVSFGENGFGYGYQWWTYPQGNFGAQGIFGQSISVFPKADLVVAVVSNRPAATGGNFGDRLVKIGFQIAAQK